MLNYSTVSLIAIRSSIERRMVNDYLMLQPEFWLMTSSTDQAARDNLGIYNTSKIEQIYSSIVKPLKIELSTEVLLRWLTLIPAIQNNGQSSVSVTEFVRLVAAQ